MQETTSFIFASLSDEAAKPILKIKSFSFNSLFVIK